MTSSTYGTVATLSSPKTVSTRAAWSTWNAITTVEAGKSFSDTGWASLALWSADTISTWWSFATRKAWSTWGASFTSWTGEAWWALGAWYTLGEDAFFTDKPAFLWISRIANSFGVCNGTKYR